MTSNELANITGLVGDETRGKVFSMPLLEDI